MGQAVGEESMPFKQLPPSPPGCSLGALPPGGQPGGPHPSEAQAGLVGTGGQAKASRAGER